jgi:signal-transduction protein with cAMP-binding, CBS, and nucleotidyltransferase domain
MSLKILKPFKQHEVGFSTPIRKALILMEHKNCDALLVKQFGECIGIITRFDILTKIIDLGLNLDSTVVGIFMSFPILTVNESVTSSQALSIMKKCKIKHLVVEKEGLYIGFVSKNELRPLSNSAKTCNQSLVYDYPASSLKNNYSLKALLFI